MTGLNSVICSIKKKYTTNYNDVNENILQHFMYDDREHFAQIAYNDENGWDAKIYYNQRRIENPDYYVVNPTNVEWEKSDHKQYGLDTKKFGAAIKQQD